MSILNKFKWSAAGWILIAVLFLTNCNKENNDVGINIQPPSDKLLVVSTDTTTVVAYSQFVDSVKTDETSVSLLGSIMDPIFGRTTASFYTQLRLAKPAFSFGTDPVADSLYLSLEYDTYYGDTNSTLTLKVYEMAQRIYIDSAYYSKNSVPVKSTLLAQKTFIPDFKNDVIVGTDTLDPHLRINLGEMSTELMDKLINAPSDSMETNTSFLNYFNGLYITVETLNSDGIMISFDLLSALSRMTLYYHNETGDSLQYEYVINSSSARFGKFVHDYSLGDPSFRAQVAYGDTALGRNVCYIQAMGGVKTHVQFPHIKNYEDDGRLALNEARLFLKPYETDPTLPYATYLVMVARTADGSFSVLDDQLEGGTYFGGFYDEKNGGYWFRITQTIQKLMRSSDPHYGFDIYLSGGAINAERIIFTGTNPEGQDLSGDRIKLVLTYTKLD